ncbi:unnamed protein product [Phytophthora fragariaefolia]|uniref:Unnamed protein product n=1 Tax=Phytophthora fragariaefolia TaxID=1490495 RepID=A0A9W6YCW1_9STRA|nr:unnamed protein product [Phytophthora fragariaefolia]
MGKDVEWSEAETIQLCKSWLETSQDPVRGVSQKKCTFYSRIYEHWLEHKPADADSRSESAIAARWKKMQPEVTKFSGLSLEVYAERHKQDFEFLGAWKTLKDKPKWNIQVTTTGGTKRTSLEALSTTRPIGVKKAKTKKQHESDGLPGDIHERFVAASEKKALILEQQLHYSIFMQFPDSDESKAYFALQRKTILASYLAAATAVSDQCIPNPHSEQDAMSIAPGDIGHETSAPETSATTGLTSIEIVDTTLVLLSYLTMVVGIADADGKAAEPPSTTAAPPIGSLGGMRVWCYPFFTLANTDLKCLNSFGLS